MSHYLRLRGRWSRRYGVPAISAALGCALTFIATTLIAGGLVQAQTGSGTQTQTQTQTPTEGRAVDLELVLAVDTSSSVSTAEFDLQMIGLARAFRDQRVIQAIRASGDLGIAVTLIQWSDNRKQIRAVNWAHVRDEASAVTFSKKLDNTPRFLIGGGTAISGAIKFATRQFDDNGFKGRRRVIDVSGDGRANQGAQPADLRDLAVAQGITINGLAILNEDSTTASYYFANVIGGTGAFVMTANDYEAYSAAILAKLVKEIAGAPIAERPQFDDLAADDQTPGGGASMRSGRGSPRPAERGRNNGVRTSAGLVFPG